MEDCLLCLQKNKECLNVNSTQELNIKSIIEKHFWVMDSLLSSSWICTYCWQTLYDFHQFYMDIEKAHNDLSKIILKPQKEDETIDEQEIFDENRGLVFKVEAEPEILINQVWVEDIKPIIKIEQDEDMDDKSMEQIQKTKRKRHLNENVSTKQDPLKKSKHSKPPSKRNNKKKESCRSTKSIENNVENAATTTANSLENSEKSANEINNELEYIQTTEKIKSGRKKRNPNKAVDFLEIDKFLAEHFKMACVICQIPLTDWEALRKHFEQEHNDKPYAVCCERKLYNRRTLQEHVYRHVDPEKFKCNICGKVSSSTASLELHQLRHLPEEEKKFTCKECGKNFAGKQFLDFHIKAVHLRKYMKICELCGKSIHPTELKRHTLEHEGKSLPLVYCEICGAGLSHKKVLRLHMKFKHTVEEKKPKCPICNKISANDNALARHMEYVHTKTLHKCTICEKEFKAPRDLREHMPIHTGIALHTCKWCPKTFNSNSNIFSHCKKYHPTEYEDQRQKQFLEGHKKHRFTKLIVTGV